jgi:hypothetical protein
VLTLTLRYACTDNNPTRKNIPIGIVVAPRRRWTSSLVCIRYNFCLVFVTVDM